MRIGDDYCSTSDLTPQQIPCFSQDLSAADLSSATPQKWKKMQQRQKKRAALLETPDITESMVSVGVGVPPTLLRASGETRCHLLKPSAAGILGQALVRVQVRGVCGNYRST